MNNLRLIKRNIRLMLGFDSFETTDKTICGIKIMHMIKKEQIEEIHAVSCEFALISKIMGIAV